MRNKILWLIVFCALADFAFAIAGKTNNNWKTVDENADGAWDDDSHWTLGMPGAAHYAYFPGGLGSYTVTFPEGDVEIETSFRANVNEGETLTFDGRGSNFRQGARETDTYHHEPFGFRYKGGHFFNQQQYSGVDSTIARHAFSEMTNFVVRLSGDGGPRFYFDQGYLDLHKPCSSSGWGALTMLFAQGAAVNAAAFPYEGLISFGKNTETRFGTVYLQGNNLTNTLEFTGGHHEFMSTFSVPDKSQTMVNKETLTTIRVADEAEVVFKGPMYFGDSGSTFGDTAKRIFRLVAEDGGRCAISNSLVQRNVGMLKIEVKNGAVMDLAGDSTLASIAGCTSSVTVADATLKINANMKNGGAGEIKLLATNAVVAISSSGQYEQFSGVADFVDSSISAAGKFIVSGSAKACFDGEKASSLFNNAFYVGNSGSSKSETVVSGGVHVFKGSIYIGQYGNGVFNVIGGSVSNLAGTGSAFAYFGVEPSSLGKLSVSGGSFSAPGSYGIMAGYKGLGRIEVSGGELRTSRIQLGMFDSASQMEADVFEQSGGKVDITGSGEEFGLRAAIYSNRKAIVSLSGGVLKCTRLSGGAGEALFYADGGKIEVSAANADFFGNFDLAELGETGLEICSDYDIVVAQKFTKNSNGGRLVLSGKGTKTFTSAETSLSTLEIAGGKAVFPAGIASLGAVVVKGNGTLAFDGEPPASAISSLVLGDDGSVGILKVNRGKPIKVAGDVTVNAVKIVLDEEYAFGEDGSDFRVLEFAGEISEESEKRLALAIAEGLAEGDVAEFSIVGDAGSRCVSVKIRKRSDITIRLDAGVSNATENVSFAIGETLTAIAGTQVMLMMDGVYGCGKFVKEGSGKVVLASDDSKFLDGILLAGGLLSSGDLNALVYGDPASSGAIVLSNGTLEVTRPAEGLHLVKPLHFESAPTNMVYANNVYRGRDAVIIKNEVPLAMPVPSPAKAAFMKRGIAPLTIEVDGTAAFPAERGHDVFGYDPSQSFSEYVFDDYGNVPEKCVYPALSIVEGELKFKGTGSEPAEIGVYGSIMLSVPTKSVAVQPSLVLDNTRFVNKESGTRAFIGLFSRYANMAVSEVTLVITNNSIFSADTVIVNKNTASGAKTRIDVDSSKFIATYLLYAGYGYLNDIVYSFRNGSELLAKGVSLNSAVKMNFDNSRFAKDENLSPVELVAYGQADFDFNFRNGSEFFCNSVKAYYSDMPDMKVNLLFNDSKWTPGGGDCNFSVIAATGVNVSVEGRGLVLMPPEGKTWTMNLPISGSGGMVASGKGKVVLDASKWAAEGVAEVEADATLDLGGSEAQGLYVTGAGTVENGTISGGGIAVSVDIEGANTLEGTPLLRNIDFSGFVRVKLEIEDGVLSEPYRPIAVARYEGDAPAVDSWRMKKLSYDRTISAKFSAVDGMVYMTPTRLGTTIIMR